MNHNDLPAGRRFCENDVSDLPHSETEVAGCVPIPADATGDRIRSVPARLPLPSGSAPRSLYPLDQYCFPPNAPSRCND